MRNLTCCATILLCASAIAIPATAAPANDYLDIRSRAFLNNWENGRFERDRELFALAGEVAAAMGK